MKQLIKDLESVLERMKKLGVKDVCFETENFKIDSEGWTKHEECLENDTKDVWEIRNGELAGEQLFTWDAAMRETKKAGKTMPTKKDFVNNFMVVIPDWTKAGYRNGGSGGFYSLGSYGGYWSSSVNGATASNLSFNSGGVSPGNNINRGFGFSVRCLKD